MSIEETIKARIEAEKSDLEKRVTLEEVDRLESALKDIKADYDEAYDLAVSKGYIVTDEPAAEAEDTTEEVTEEVETPSEETDTTEEASEEAPEVVEPITPTNY